MLRARRSPPVRDPPPTTTSTTLTGAPRALEVVAAVAAPTTLVTALMFSFGWSHAYYFCIYFGVNSTLLDFTTQDYLMRSVDGLFVPLTVAAVLVLVGTAVRRGVRARLGRVRDDDAALTGRVLAVSGLAAGVGLATVGFLTALGLRVVPVAYVAALALAVGVVLVLWSTRAIRAVGPPAPPGEGTAIVEWVATFVLVSMALFWAVSDYSANVGLRQARATEADLARQPAVVVYSAKDLGLRLPGVRETSCTAADATYRVRYGGLVLVLESGNQYFLLPRTWTPRTPALVLPRSDAVRLQFTADPSVPDSAAAC